MAEKIVVTKTMQDDLDGTEWNPDDESAGRSVRFAWAGKEYTIDLKAENADEFQRLMARYVSASRHVGNVRHVERAAGSSHGSSSRRRGGGNTMGRSKEELQEIRAWLRAKGETVADSGLIPRRLLEMWEQRDNTPEPIPGTVPSVRPAGKAPGGKPEEKPEDAKKGPVKASPLDALIPPVSAPVFSRGSDNR